MTLDDSHCFTHLPTGAFEMTFKVDAADRFAIQKALALRNSQESGVPDAYHDDATYEGRLLAEICRGWFEFLGEWPSLDDEA